MIELDGLYWLVISGGVLLLLQIGLHREIQGVFLLLTRRADVSMVLFSILFFPGIVIHETSHYLMARLLGVRTGRFSLIPSQTADGRLRLGFVETSSTDITREAMIGAAPLISGGLIVAAIGIRQFDVLVLWMGIQNGTLNSWQNGMALIYQSPDFWFWLYLAFVISSTMMPSRSDRRAWLPLIAVLLLIVGVSLLAGAGPWLLENVAPAINIILKSISFVFIISLIIHLWLWLPSLLLRVILERITGLRIV